LEKLHPSDVQEEIVKVVAARQLIAVSVWEREQDDGLEADSFSVTDGSLVVDD
jgi:hypothetical protein